MALNVSILSSLFLAVIKFPVMWVVKKSLGKRLMDDGFTFAKDAKPNPSNLADIRS